LALLLATEEALSNAAAAGSTVHAEFSSGAWLPAVQRLAEGLLFSALLTILAKLLWNSHVPSRVEIPTLRLAAVIGP
jgi:hypothetical protein